MAHLLDRIGGRRGHFRMESGLHAAVWFDLDQLFVDPTILDPAIVELAESCGRTLLMRCVGRS